MIPYMDNKKEKTMKTYRVSFCYEEGMKLTVQANNAKEADKKAKELADLYAQSSYPKEYNFEFLYRDYSTSDVQEVVA